MTPAPLTASGTDLASSAPDVNAANLALGHEVFEAESAKFMRNRSFPSIYDANHVTHVTASTPEEIDGLIARVEIEYQGHRPSLVRCRFANAPVFTARLALEGCKRRDALVMVLEGELKRRGAKTRNPSS